MNELTQKFLPGCPWFDLHANHPPNIDWCEEKLCSWIVTPFNTWTNLGYMLIGLFIWNQMRKSQSRVLRFFGPAMFIVGLSSLIYHASLNFYTQIFDFFGMYTFCVLLIMFNLSRVKKWPEPPKAFRWFWIWTIVLTIVTTVCLMISIHFPIQIFVFGCIIAILVTELKATAPSRKYFWLTLVSIFSAAVFSALDASRVLCNPENHLFQGHGVWHILGAVALFFSFKHYQQFEKEIH
jgi:hypothetical protein